MRSIRYLLVAAIALTAVYVPVQRLSAVMLKRTPLAEDDQYYTPVNTPLYVYDPGFLENDQFDPMWGWASSGDEDGPSFPEHGDIQFEGGNSGGFVYVPDTDFVGVDSFGYVVYDESDSSEIVHCYIYVGIEPEGRSVKRGSAKQQSSKQQSSKQQSVKQVKSR